MAEFEEAVLTQRLKPQALAAMFDIVKSTALWNWKRVLAEHGICIRQYNKEVRKANPKSYSPKMPKEFYLERYNKGYWDFDNNKWVYGTTQQDLAKIAGISERMVGRDIHHYKIKKHREEIPAGLDVKGKKFGLLKPVRLISIEKKQHGHNQYSSYIYNWECECDCGTMCEKTDRSLRHHDYNSTIKNSCGCENKKFARWESLDIIPRHFNRIKTSAKRRKLEFDLTPEFVVRVILGRVDTSSWILLAIFDKDSSSILPEIAICITWDWILYSLIIGFSAWTGKVVIALTVDVISSFALEISSPGRSST